MAKLRLHLDADTSIKRLAQVLPERGHDVTRTPTSWMPLDAEDEIQLLGATAHGRCIFTFNIGDFVTLAGKYPEYEGIILAHQVAWTLSNLIQALDRLVNDAEPSELRGTVRWLNDWRG